jgi:hypothetical protein
MHKPTSTVYEKPTSYEVPNDLKPGDRVDYHSIIDGPVTQSYLEVETSPTKPDSGELVVWLKGNPGAFPWMLYR